MAMISIHIGLVTGPYDSIPPSSFIPMIVFPHRHSSLSQVLYQQWIVVIVIINGIRMEEGLLLMIVECIPLITILRTVMIGQRSRELLEIHYRSCDGYYSKMISHTNHDNSNINKIMIVLIRIVYIMNSFPDIVTYSVIAMGYNRVYIYSMYEKNMRVIVMTIRSTYSIIWVVQ